MKMPTFLLCCVLHFARAARLLADGLDDLKKAAVRGDATAQHNLGIMYDNGKIVARDAAKAVEWYEKAALQGVSQSQTNLGIMYAKGDGVPRDAAKAVEWWQKAAAQGHANGQYNLGVMYAKGDGVPRDAVKAVELYQKSAAQGHAGAQLNLGTMYYKGSGIPRDAAKAAEWWQKPAKQGDADAQTNLGFCYANGEGVPKDIIRGVAWLSLAAVQEHDGAKKMRDELEELITPEQKAQVQNLLGTMYAEGLGVPKDAIKAFEWYHKAANQGDAEAQFYLGLMYATGRGVTKNEIRAYAWFNISAARNYRDAAVRRDALEKAMTAEQRAAAQNHLGEMYAIGIGVPKDATKAVEWYLKAAAQGDTEAQYTLGLMYETGGMNTRSRVPKDEAKAAEWYRKAAEGIMKAAEQGDATAQFKLGMMYGRGNGVQKNLVRAYAWMNIAAMQGNIGARGGQRDFEREMTAEQIAQAKKLSLELFAKMPKK